MAIISVFYKRLRDLCEERNMTVNELVKVLDLSSGSPTAWKNGTVPRRATVDKIAAYLKVPAAYLLGQTNIRPIALFDNIGGGHAALQKNNAPDELVLTEDEMRILSAFREMSPERQKALADLLGISDPQK